MSDVWLDAHGAAERADVSDATILRAARVGKLRGYKIAGGRLWRFRPEDVDRWIVGERTPVLVEPRFDRRAG